MVNTDKEVDAVVKAWVDSGHAPDYHYHKMSELHKTWPTLANAIVALVLKQGQKEEPIE